MTVDSDSKAGTDPTAAPAADSGDAAAPTDSSDASSDSSAISPAPDLELQAGSARPVILMTLLAVSVLAVGAIGYALFALRGGPALVIEAPADNARTLARTIEVRGHIDGTRPQLTINGREIPLTEAEGRWTFAAAVPIEPGDNHLLFAASEGEQETQLLRKVESLNALLLDLHPSETGTVTSASTITVRGRLIPALPGEVKIGALRTTLNAEGRFELPGQTLEEGENLLQLEVHPKGEDTLTKQLRAVRDTSPPALEWTWPKNDAAVLEDEIRIEGIAEDIHLKRVTLNGQEIASSSGSFKSTFALPSLGPHRLTLVARDRLGHTTTLTRTVRRVERLAVAPPQLTQRWQKVRREAEQSLVLIVIEMQGERASGGTASYRFQGTGVFVSSLGHVLAPKRLIQPWKYRDFATRLAAEDVAIIDSSTHIHAWTSGATVRRPDGTLDLASGFSTRSGTLTRLRADPDEWEGYSPPGALSRLLMVHKENQRDGLALLRVQTTTSVRLPFLRPDMNLTPGEEVLIVGFAPGSQPARARATHALGKVSSTQRQITMDAEPMGGYLSGPVLNRWGRVVGIAEHLRQGRTLRHVSLHVGAARRILYGTSYGRNRPRVPW